MYVHVQVYTSNVCAYTGGLVYVYVCMSRCVCVCVCVCLKQIATSGIVPLEHCPAGF